MAVPMKGFLRRLRAEGGCWSYAVFWKAVQRSNSRNLVWGEGDYGSTISVPDIPVPWCEAALNEGSGLSDGTQPKKFHGELGGQAVQMIAVLVETTMKPKVHNVGYGVLGTVMLTGNHRWLVHGRAAPDAYHIQGLAEFNEQWFSGIQTIAVIPVPPHGVLQLGSTQLITENLELVNQTRGAFAQLACISEPSFSEGSQSLLENGHHWVPPMNSVNINHQDQRNLDSRQLTQLSISSVSEISWSIPSIPELSVCSKAPHSGYFSSLDELLPQKAIPIMKSGFSNLGEHHNGSDGHCVLSDLNMMLNKQLVAADRTPDKQCKTFNNSLLPSDNPFSLQHLFSSLKSQYIRSNDHFMCNAKFLQPNSHGPPSYSTTSTLILPSRIEEPIGYENVNEKLGPLLGRANGNASIGLESKISQVEASRIVDDTTNSGSSHPLPSATKISCLSESRSLSASAPMLQRHNMGGNLLQAPQMPYRDLPGPFSCSDVSSQGQIPGISFQTRRAPQNGSHDERSSVLLDDRNACSHATDALASVDLVAEDVYQASDICYSGSDLFDVLGLSQISNRCTGNVDALVNTSELEDSRKYGINDSIYTTQLAKDYIFSPSNCVLTSESLPDNTNNELLDAVVAKVNGTVRQDTDEITCKTSLIRTTGSSYNIDHLNCSQPDLTRNFQKELFNISPRMLQTGMSDYPNFKSSSSVNEIGECSRIEGICNSRNNFWVDNENIRNEVAPGQCRPVEDSGKSNRKRPKPGDNPRPRPKDRQMIQDRLKELREIVPNGAKLSIDALLERTIKHMLFLQSVTKHADKLKETKEPKIISEEGGLRLKDNFEGGATWAFEVGSQSMICPIIVEDLNPPRQLLVEMLCEQRGLFLEIADLIKGLGLTILKGVMEVRNDKVWARFAVEADRDVTRMDIFLSLVQLLEPRAVSSVPQQHFNGINMTHNVVGQRIAATCAVDPLM